MTNGEFVSGINSDKMLKNVIRVNCLVPKITPNFYSHLSLINIRYYLEFRTRIMDRQVFKILSQNPEFVKYYSNDGKNLFQFSIRKWMINQ